MTTMQVSRCQACGLPLPPTSAPAHHCPTQFNVIFPQSWSEQAIRQIAMEAIRDYMSAKDSKP